MNGKSAAFLVCTAAALALSPLAAATRVTTVQELTNTLDRINKGTLSDLTVTIAAGTYDLSGVAMTNEAALLITKSNVVLQGEDAASWRMRADSNTVTILDVKQQRAVIAMDYNKVSGCTFRHLTIANGFRNGNGAGIFNGWYKNSVTLTNCVLRNNRTGTAASYQGGAGHMLAPTDCLFIDNYAKGEGGAFCGGGPTKNCVFIRNTAGGNGGAVRNGNNVSGCVFVANSGGNGTIYASSYNVSDCTFVNNTNWNSGCVTYDYLYRSAKVTNCRFYKNRSNNIGNGTCVNNGQGVVSNCVFVGNSAAGGGAAICTTTNGMTIIDCAFTNNVAAKDGGAVRGGEDRMDQRPLVIHCDFYGNEATNRGGSVAWVSATNCTFIGGYSDAYGGAAALSCLTNCVFSGCTANKWGGAVSQCQLSHCLITNCAVREQCTKDVGDRAGAIYAGSGTYVARDVRIVDCGWTNGTDRVAAVYGRYEDCVFERCVPRNVTAATRCRVYGPDGTQITSVLGGGAYTNCLVTGVNSGYAFSNPTLVNCTVVSNNLQNSGGQLFANGCRAWNSIVVGNVYGGYDFAGYGDFYMTNCVFKSVPNWEGTLRTHFGGTIAERDSKKLFAQPTDKYYDAAEPYALRKRSPARNAGCTVYWPEGATDLIGNPRVHADDASRIDCGCYEFSLPYDGILMIVR